MSAANDAKTLYSTRRGPRYVAPPHLLVPTVDETFRDRVRPFDHSNAGGFSKYLTNMYPKTHLGYQWDASARLGTQRLERHLTQRLDPHAFYRPRDPVGHLKHARSLTDLRGIPSHGKTPSKHPDAGQFLTDAAEGKLIFDESQVAPLLSATNQVIYNKPIREMQIFPQSNFPVTVMHDNRAGTDPGAQMTPATGYVNPELQKDYVSLRAHDAAFHDKINPQGGFIAEVPQTATVQRFLSEPGREGGGNRGNNCRPFPTH